MMTSQEQITTNYEAHHNEIVTILLLLPLQIISTPYSQRLLIYETLSGLTGTLLANPFFFCGVD
jgi:hypothetical protein